VALALSAPVDCVPLVALLPDHAPDATQEVAFAALQRRAELAPFATVLGGAVMLTEGAADFTETVAVCVAEPPDPVQVIAKVASPFIAPVD